MYLTPGDNTIIIRLVPKEEDLASVNITVYLENTNIGVAGVAIYIDNQYEGVTDHNGFIGIDGFTLGYHSGRAEKAGYVTTTF